MAPARTGSAGAWLEGFADPRFEEVFVAVRFLARVFFFVADFLAALLGAVFFLAAFFFALFFVVGFFFTTRTFFLPAFLFVAIDSSPGQNCRAGDYPVAADNRRE
jgi:hypothetical protein